MPTLISSGCSFIWGNELSDSTPERPSLQTWPALLAQQKGMEYVCVAKPGGGNQAITRKVIKAVSNTPDVAMVAVMWTWTARLELQLNSILETEYYRLHENLQMPGQMDDSGWINICISNMKPWKQKADFFQANESHAEKLKKQYDFLQDHGITEYTRNIFSLTDISYANYMTMQSVLFLQYFLQNKNIPYIFSCATDELLVAKNDKAPLTDLIDWDRFLCMEGFLNWTRDNNPEFCPFGHPAASAHAAWLQSHDKYI
jgi:hypothetical protein